MTRSVRMRNVSSFVGPVCLIASVLALVPSAPIGAATVTSGQSQVRPLPLERQRVVIDTDIGDDVDDAFAVALALDSPEFDILGFTTTTGNTLARARILDRMLAESGHANIPVAIGRPPISFPANGGIGPQRAYGEGIPPLKESYPDASDFILEQLRKFPGEVTLVTIGPLTNIAAAIDKDPQTFRKLKRVVMMGGWLAEADDGYGETRPVEPEANIMLNVGAAQKLFQSGVQIFVMPLDSALHLLLDEVKRERIFFQATKLTNSLNVLYFLWGRRTPVLADAMAVGFTVNSQLCPVQPIQIIVNDKGMTTVGGGTPNAHVCLRSDPSRFFEYYLDRVAPPKHIGAP